MFDFGIENFKKSLLVEKLNQIFGSAYETSKQKFANFGQQ